MSPRQLAILQHALGLDQYGRGESYRNHYAAGDDDVADCQALIALGYMRQVATTAVFPDFNCRVTEEGLQAARRESPKPPKVTRAQRRYLRWLKVADCFPDWSFGDWLKYEAEKARVSR